MIHLIAALVICTLASPASGQERVPIDQKERVALLALYNSAGGAKWTNHIGWTGRPGSECTWFGVECGFVGGLRFHETVTGLSLENNNLVGTLPPEINNLALAKLWVSGNRLSCVLPQRILDKWETGALREAGDAYQFATQIDEIV